MSQHLYGTLEGFKYLYAPKPCLGAYVTIEASARGLLRYGAFDEYHTYYMDPVFQVRAHDSLARTCQESGKLKLVRLRESVGTPLPAYDILHFETIQPAREIAFRSLLSNVRTPVTRQAYTIATLANVREFLDLCLLNQGCRPYDSIVAPSRAAAEAITAYMTEVESRTEGKVRYRGRVDTIPHGFETEDSRPMDKASARRTLELPAHAVILLSLGRISWRSKMNYDRLLRSVAQLAKASPVELLLVVAGADSDGESAQVRNLATTLGLSDKIRLITDFRDDQKTAIYSASDIFVSLSDNLQESFGLTLVEAMAVGLPVLCTDWDGYRDIVEDGVQGFRIPVEWQVRRRPSDLLAQFRHPYDHTLIHQSSRDLKIDSGQLVSKALDLINNAELRYSMGQRARQRVRDEFSMKAVVARYEDLWTELKGMADQDQREYPNLGPVLSYDYPKHFRGYPTTLVDDGSV
ncbi:glycosyltransferase family 4 protein [candidate division WOR-3 bacterium]|uniref:Glycosyltransferase family 4 protein n=1 Tax=candidate division WOR-3 bacterium TaxID=2052148 RepID=A0A937XGL0_UNCW3|nr:glycosyltransferase family 4 protein [candidate division WOR-3 bacterium]